MRLNLIRLRRAFLEEKPQPHFVSQFDCVYSVEDKKFFIGELITPMRYIRKISILVCNRNHTCLHYVCRNCSSRFHCGGRINGHGVRWITSSSISLLLILSYASSDCSSSNGSSSLSDSFPISFLISFNFTLISLLFFFVPTLPCLIPAWYVVAG